MVAFMKDNGGITNRMVKVNRSILMGVLMMEIGIMVWRMGKGFINILMVANILECGKMIKSMA